MINTKKFAVAFGLALCVVASPALAAVTFTRTAVDNSSQAALAGFITNDVKINFDGQYTGSQALIELTGGGTLIYQDAAGSASAPSPVFVGLVPSLAFDTYVAQGSALSGGANGEPSLGGGAVDLGGAPGAVFTNALINQAWNPAGGVTIVDQSNFMIGRFSLAATANGTAKFLASAGGTPITQNGTVTNGVISFGDIVNIAPDVTDAIQNITLDSGNPPVLTNFAFQMLATDDGVPTPGLTWALQNFTGPGAPTAAPALSAGGNFTWTPNGSKGGQYIATVRATDNGQLFADGTLTINLTVPEPATLSLLGLALVGCVGFARRR